jgi:outer membrane protein OmpU
MNNFKKIGMTALAASLVSTSVFAGELTVAGSASINFENHSAAALNEAKTFSMGNQITFSGSGELDNGMNVSLSFVLDQGDDSATADTTTMAGSPFDSHSVTVSSDALGTLKFSGEGGASATSSIGGTVGGNMWDNFNSNGGVTLTNSAAGNNSFFYTLPSMVDGLGVTASLEPQDSDSKTQTGLGISYTGIEGLTANYATTNVETYAAGTTGEENAWKLSYAYGSLTLAASNVEYDVGTSTSDQSTDSYKVSYSVTDDFSVSYKTEEITVGTASQVDAEFDGVSASYTAGGMTVSANMQEGTNVGNTTSASQDYYGLGLSFAF